MSLLHRWMLKKLGVAQTHPVTIQPNHKVRTPDGVELVTDLYLGSPDGGPAVLLRSPYGRSATLAAGMAYPIAARGYNVALQSCRGTFGSTGSFDPHHDEQRDGLATLDWIRQQPWYDGAIATFGPSYLGYVQWAVAAAAGPEVKAMAMQVTLSDFSLMTYSGDAYSLENALTWTYMTNLMKSKRGLLKLVLNRILRRPAITQTQWRALPLATLDEEVVGQRVKFWQDWMQHDSSRDPWWAPMSFRNSIPHIRRPITMVAGWHDIFLPMQMHDFIEMRKAGVESRITIGPWRHQDVDLGRAGIHDALDWFDHHLRGKPLAARKAVKLFVTGADEWRSFDEWPPRESTMERWYLQPQKGLGRQTAADSPPDTYRYDPADPTPSLGGPALDLTPYSVDNASLERRADVLTYTSEAFSAPRDLAGPVVAELYVSSDAASADFFVRVCDVDESGVSMNVCDGLQRVRIASAGSPQPVRVELWPTAYRFKPGHRVRVQISSGAFPRWARNLGGSESMAAATTARIAAQSIFHSPACPSAMVLPFLVQ